jgi:hypothetical protein
LVCREAYADGNAVNEHLAAVGPLLGRILTAGVAELVSLHLSGPETEMAKIKPVTDPLGAVYTYTAEPGFTNIPANKMVGKEELPNTFLTINPTFTVTDWDKVQKDVIEGLSELAKTEAGCIYYYFAVNKEENKLICREAYVDGEAVNAHLANVGGPLGAAIESGVLKVDSLVVTGPADHLEIAKKTCDDMGAVYHETVGGFVHYSL